ncbi:MAG: small basic family protein [Peptococcaceae bacterium]|jgi:small basic protein|nr:small basic family protein [Peptococcaceae bacterium]
MWLPILGLITGVLIGSMFTFTIPIIYAKYLSVSVLAALDSLLGSVKALLEDSFDSAILISGFFANMLLAAGLAFMGDRLGLDLYMAAVIALGIRLFSNLGAIRRDLMEMHHTRKALKQAKAGDASNETQQ